MVLLHSIRLETATSCPPLTQDILLTPGMSSAQVAGIVSVLMTPLYLWFFMYKLRWGAVGAACSCVLEQCPAATSLIRTVPSVVSQRLTLAKHLETGSPSMWSRMRRKHWEHVTDFGATCQVHHDNIHELGATSCFHLLAPPDVAGEAGADLARHVRSVKPVQQCSRTVIVLHWLRQQVARSVWY